MGQGVVLGGIVCRVLGRTEWQGRLGMFRSIVFLLLAAGLSGCAYFYAKPPSSVEVKNLSAAQYTIGSGDQLQINVWRNPELSVSVPVRPDGRISVPLLGDVEAAGHTPEELSSSIG